MTRTDTVRDARSIAAAALLNTLGSGDGRPEERLFELGLLAPRDYAVELALLASLPFAGLRGHLPDERLFSYVPYELSYAERVCPLVVVEDSLKLATAYLDPDLRLVEERFPRLRLELVVAPRDEILAALRDVALTAR